MKTCTRCNKAKPLSAFDKQSKSSDGLRWECKECSRAYQLAYRNSDQGKKSKLHQVEKRRTSGKAKYDQIKWRYGLTQTDYESFLQTREVCEICGGSFCRRGKFIDHSHISGVVRGVLCSSCNSMLGYAKDSPGTLRKAIEYLSKTTPSFSESSACGEESTGRLQKPTKLSSLKQEPNATEAVGLGG